MTKEAGLELKKARIAAKLPVFAIAQVLHQRADRGALEEAEVEPSPDDVDRYAEAVGDPQLWDRWMRMSFDSYGKRFPDAGMNRELTLAIVGSGHEMEDVLALQGRVERAAMNGTLDDPRLKEEYRKEVLEAFTALKNVLERLD
jgi:hypothetical protein